MVLIVRVLWRRRLYLAFAALACEALLLVLAFRVSLPFELHNRRVQVAEGRANVLLDTASSQVVDAESPSATAIHILSGRAELLADLTMRPVLRDAIARRAGLEPGELQPDPARTSDAVAKAGVPSDDSVVLAAFVADLSVGDSPIVTVEVTAPTTRTAERVTVAAVAELSSYVERLTVTEGVAPGRQLVLTQLAPAEVSDVTRGRHPLASIAIAVFAFLAACAAIVGASLAAEWQRVREPA